MAIELEDLAIETFSSPKTGYHALELSHILFTGLRRSLVPAPSTESHCNLRKMHPLSQCDAMYLS